MGSREPELIDWDTSAAAGAKTGAASTCHSSRAIARHARAAATVHSPAEEAAVPPECGTVVGGGTTTAGSTSIDCTSVCCGAVACNTEEAV